MVLCLALIAPLLPQHAARAATIEVTNTADSGEGSLRAAIAAAERDDTIVFANTVVGPIELESQLVITQSMTIMGRSADPVPIRGKGASRVLYIGGSAHVEISGLEISGGNAAEGGGIYVDTGASLGIVTSDIINNTSQGHGGGIYVNGGWLYVTVSTISDNSALQGDGGGIYSNHGELVISGSIVDNDATNGGGIYTNGGSLYYTLGSIASNEADVAGGGIYTTGGIATITWANISHNQAASGGGGIHHHNSSLTIKNSAIFLNVSESGSGGGIFNEIASTLTITNSTISQNQANDGGGGIYNDPVSTVTVISSTMSENTATGSGSNIANATNGVVKLTGSIVAGHGQSCSGAITSGGYNIDSDTTCALDGAGDIEGQDPLLGPLATNGARTMTHAINGRSPAFNAFPADVCTAVLDDPDIDQRGISRPQFGACDSGAFELNVMPPAPTLTLPSAPVFVEATSAQGAPVTFEVSAVDFADAPLEVECDVTSGEIRPLGTYTISCSATDRLDQTTNGSFDLTVEDTTAPHLTLTATTPVEATGPEGATVTFDTEATDAVDPDPEVKCNLASGTILAIGPHEVSCTATDATGNTSDPVVAAITVRDSIPPSMVIPADMIVEATGPNGAVVTFEVPATDTVDPNPEVTCEPASGSTFSIGIHTVRCTATDAAGNTSPQATFTITVPGGDVLLAALIEDFRDGAIPAFLQPRLLLFLTTAELALEREQPLAACSTLQTFSTTLTTLSPHYIAAPLASQLSADAQTIRTVLGC